MSIASPRSLILVVIVIVGLVGATGLVAGFEDRPSQAAKVAAGDAACGGCPLAETLVRCQAKCQPACGADCCAECIRPECRAPLAESGCQMKATGCCDLPD
ncbi:MAG: hypothetical protein JW993_07510 [Sedimentisphaerales bacterium]|nr:hypothetical protein [Sedimentisphaerales bacterium]